MSIEITGGRELRAALRALGPAVDRRTLKAIEKAMGPLHRRAVEEAPKDTGVLAEHIRLDVSNRKGNVTASLVVKDVPYEVVVQYGAPQRHREPDPFLTRAYDAEGLPALSVALKAIAEGIERDSRSS